MEYNVDEVESVYTSSLERVGHPIRSKDEPQPKPHILYKDLFNPNDSCRCKEQKSSKKTLGTMPKCWCTKDRWCMKDGSTELHQN